MTIQIHTPLTVETVSSLKSGDKVEISGTIYTARDQAHKRIVAAIENGEALPFELAGQIIFYAGPAPTPPGKASGSIGPTTSARMDAVTPLLLEHGLKGVIGKGPRSQAVKDALSRYNAVYFAATGGVAALLSSYIKRVELIAYPDLGPEAVYKLEVENFPVIVAADAHGGDFYEQNRRLYKRA
ncbi:MAG: fumarate hydratase [Candidatus Aquicultor secundus]|uniref:Fumarate hydratase n=1 Tax=Candidatus Aquicultor secundus TaxID=1973895 RepID=A0A2M7T8Z9_9ACTN|nr:TRZ/ATZ family protein [Solirubrobacter sp.]OIO88170.1 MAG: fumarate hydratase [Candidatus Aquicultor secundus]PIU25973.1 MAG: fumarate hydratase [Candidatus Aquicultor secundus]PIW22494.1 MAG: fumarate hydratase [Candidatus Aquicultor secundus]PIX51703.1 MAG: fumarate hydratase [Candidatus Aquicultor secundus]